jgi:lipopolysaccharide export system protein LptA
MNIFYKIVLYFNLGLLLSLFSISQNLNQTSQPIELLWADEIVKSDTTGINIREFIGKVSIRQGKVKLFCDKAIQNLDIATFTLIGNVRILQDEMVLTSPKIVYNTIDGIAESFVSLKIKDKFATLIADKGKYNTRTYIADFIKNVEIIDDTVNIKSDTLSYNRISRVSDAWGHVRVEDDSMLIFAHYMNYKRESKNTKAFGDVYIKHKNRRSVLTCDTLFNLNSENYSLAYGNPVVFFIDSSRTTSRLDTSMIKSDTIEAFTPKGSEQFIFKKKVELLREKIAAKCELMKYFRSAEMLELRENPVLWVDSTQLHSDSITIYLENNKLKKIQSNNNSLLTSREDSLDADLINQISGYSIVMEFEKDTIRYIHSYGNSKSLYFVRNDDNSLAASRNASDNMDIIFDEGKPADINWIGTVAGEYFPETLFTGGVEKYYLPLFKLRFDKPIKKSLQNRE